MAAALERFPERWYHLYTTMPEETIVRRKLADEVLDRLLAMVERGELKPGDRLPGERELMKRFSVGRPAVREALQALAGMGLIQIQHGERAQLLALEPRQVLETMDLSVKHLLQTSPASQQHLREARLMFESAMVKRAAQRAAKEDVSVLEDAHSILCESAGNTPKFIQADIAFHVAIARISGNPLFAAFSEALLGWLFAFHPRLLRAPGAEEITIREHAKILEAIRKHKPNLAEEALSAHLQRSDPEYRGS